jgi:hypothetical protein
MLLVNNENLLKVIYNNLYQNELLRFQKELRNRYLLKLTSSFCRKEIDYISFEDDTLAIWYKNTDYSDYNKKYFNVPIRKGSIKSVINKNVFDILHLTNRNTNIVIKHIFPKNLTETLYTGTQSIIIKDNETDPKSFFIIANSEILLIDCDGLTLTKLVNPFNDNENIHLSINTTNIISNIYIFQVNGKNLTYYDGHNNRHQITLEYPWELRDVVIQKSNESAILIYDIDILVLDLVNCVINKELNIDEIIFSYVKLNSDTILLLTGESSVAYVVDINDLHITKKMLFPGGEMLMDQYKLFYNKNYIVFQNSYGFYFYLPESFTYIGFCARKYQRYYETTLIGYNLLTYDLNILDNQVTYFISNLKKLTESVSLEGTLIENVIRLSYKYLAIFTDRKIYLYNVKTKSFIKTFKCNYGFSTYKTNYSSRKFAFIEDSHYDKYLKIYDIEKNYLMTTILKVDEYALFCFSEKYLFAFGTGIKGIIKIDLKTSNYEKTCVIDTYSIADVYYIGVGYLMIQVSTGVLLYNIKTDAVEAHLFEGKIHQNNELSCKTVYSNGKYLAMWIEDKILLFDKVRQRELSFSIVSNHQGKILKIEYNAIYLQSENSIFCYVLESKKVKFERTLL